MKEPLDSRHESKRNFCRRLGICLVIAGGSLIAIGLGSFFMSMGSMSPPRFFWCAFLGGPVFIAGVSLTQFGFIGALFRYTAGETAPVAKDTFNYMADGTQEGVKTMAAAIGSGLSEGLGGGAGGQTAVRCPKCNHLNEADSKFCSDCGSALQKTKSCPDCLELNDPDARFCDNCGRTLA